MHSQTQPKRWRKLFILIVALALATIGYLSFAHKEIVPDVNFTTLDGTQIPLKSLRGKVVMINFWATSCTTCVAEMPEMVRTYTMYKDKGLDYIAVAMSYDPPNYVTNFVRTRNLPFHVTLDTQNTLAHAFGDVKLTPTTFVIDKQGNIIKRYVGAPQFSELHALLEKVLAS